MLQQIDLSAPVRAFTAGADYELRLLDRSGRTISIYRARHLGDDDARRMILDIRDVDYDRFEVWREMTKICEGPRLIVR